MCVSEYAYVWEVCAVPVLVEMSEYESLYNEF